ncbi:HNH endonuclease [Burkholderia cepacia]|uniref:HNH endonuclease n=1 Tax=Burkholderia cepacia TaxID=292 RepID=UPI003A4E250D
MSTRSEIVAALQAAGIDARLTDPRADQGCIVTVRGYPRALRLYAWQVSDNGRATGTVRPADERRIQASTTQLIDASPDPETVVLGWCDEFAPEPLIVAFNPYGVASRVNRKIQPKLAAREPNARASDSQQFRQTLLDEAYARGIAFGPNQHGEHVVAMKPERFLDYLNRKPEFHPNGVVWNVPPVAGRSMQNLVEEAELDEGAPADAVGVSPLPAFDPATVEDGRERVAREIAIRRGQAEFRSQLLRAYGCCAISGCTVTAVLEAAHIVPYQGPGTNHVANGLLLRADLHTLFDFGLLAVDHATLTIVVAADLNGTEYEAYRGQPLRTGFGRATPSPDALQIHRHFAGI